MQNKYISDDLSTLSDLDRIVKIVLFLKQKQIRYVNPMLDDRAMYSSVLHTFFLATNRI